MGTELYGEGVDCDRCIDESVIGWGDELCLTGGAGRTGMLGRCARAAGRVIFGSGACAPWAAAFAASVVGVPLRVDGALNDLCWLFPITGLWFPASTFATASFAPLLPTVNAFLKLTR